jgi:hypothetical protein
MAPRPTVVVVSKKKPNKIKFLAPILFLMAELNGANIIYAIEKTAIIMETSLEFKVYPSLESHSLLSFFSSKYVGKKTATFNSIIFAIHRDVIQEIKIFFFVASEKSPPYFEGIVS